MKKLICYILFAIVLIAPVSAQDRNVEHRLVLDIPFYFQGGMESDIRYDIDSLALVNSLRQIELLGRDKTSIIKSVEFYSSVSPEGTIRFNKELGKIRLATAERMVRNLLNIADSVAVTRDERYIPWHDYLLPAIEADTTIPYRNELLKLIYRAPDAKGADNRRVNLKLRNGGKLWEVVERYFFDHIRKGGAIIVVERIASEEIIPTLENQPTLLRGVEEMEQAALLLPSSNSSSSSLSAEHDGTQSQLSEKSAQGGASSSSQSVKERDFALSVKTNALGWGLAITNAAVEFDFAKHWSVAVPIYYAAHNYFTPTIKFRTLAFQPEVRYWLKDNNLGFFAGAHLGVASYNVAVAGIERYQDHAGKTPALGGGISIGYKMPLSKKRENWQIEFTIGAGAYRLHYDTFYNVENGRLIDTFRKTYWGIDNAAVNISYRFDIKNRKR